MRLNTTHSRTRHAQIGVPAAVLGVLASAFSAAPATAAVPADTQPDQHIRSVPQPLTTVASANRAPTTAHAVAHTNPPPATYTVKPGDTVSAIASRFGLAVADVFSWNDLGWRSVIYPGQTLSLVAPAPAAPAPAAPAPAASTHTVVAGDTIFALAQKHNTTVDALLAANGLNSSSIIYPGQKLIVNAAAPAPTPPSDTATTAALSVPQAENAAMIIRIGRELGIPDRGIAIALATSMVESWLRNLDWGDRDSLGLFQQRPSTGWGTPEQIMNRDRSIRVFYGGQSDPNGSNSRGLLDVTGWESLSFSAAAQSVQISAYPDRYGQWEAQAYEWLALYG